MSDETITFDDVSPAEIAVVRGHGPGIRSQAVYDALVFIGGQFANGRAARITGVTQPHFRGQLYEACKTRWPGIRVCRFGETIDVSLPEPASAEVS